MTTPATRSPAPADASVGTLVAQLSEQTARLVRDELKLAQLEMAQKGKRAGLGAGLFGGAGVLAAYGLGALVATAIAGLATAVDVWLAALIVAVALFVIAGTAALVGKREIAQATPPLPAEAVAGLKQDVQTLKPRPRMSEANDSAAGADDAAATPTIDEVRAEIAETRAELQETVDALAGKLNVKEHGRQKVEAAKASVGDAAARAKQATPEPVQHALDRAAATAAPVAHKAAPYRKPLLAGALAAVVAFVVVKRRRG